MATGAKSELIDLLGDVKSRIQDKLGKVDFPIPQFILLGKQSVGKSRLCESLAGETFNFTSGTLGSRRPTVLEFRNVPKAPESRWFVRDRETNKWQEHNVQRVMQIVGQAHEELGKTASEIPVDVKLESANCVDMLIVDLPGFRDFAMDDGTRALGDQIERLNMKFMEDKRNVMICVEQAGDAATMSTLGKCKVLDPKLQRTILVRNKLDKYYSDLTQANVNAWIKGYGDLPDDVVSFCLTLPFWADGQQPPKPFHEIRTDRNKDDVQNMQQRGAVAKNLTKIGFTNFQVYMEARIESMFAEAIDPLLIALRKERETIDKRSKDVMAEYVETDPNRILSTTRDCGISFATALSHVLEGVLHLTEGRLTLEAELTAFHAYHQALGQVDFELLPTGDYSSLQDYVDFLRNEAKVGAFDLEINGGAQFRRLMSEVEIFLRFSEIAVDIKKRDVIQARGVSMSSLTWRDVVVKLLNNEAHLPLQRRVLYVGHRLKWFFKEQKSAVLEFMDSLEGTPRAQMYSPLFPKHAILIRNNMMIKELVYKTYDDACDRQLNAFVDLFDNMLTSTFANPWVFLKGYTKEGDDSENLQDAVLPSFDDTKERIPAEIKGRSGIEAQINKQLQSIPTEPGEIDDAVDRVQILVLKTYSFIRSQVCDQVELFGESFFKLPMLRKLEEDMSKMELSEEDKQQYEAVRARLTTEKKEKDTALTEIDYCIKRLNDFKLNTEARKGSR
jgi:GTP-binding protein EngB required for normal cell division